MTQLIKYTLMAALALALVATTAVAEDVHKGFVVVKARRVITVSGAEFSPGIVVIENGKISLVGGSKIEYPPTAKMIDAGRATVMPGFVHPRTRFGLADYRRSGVNGDQHVTDEVYLSEIDFEPMLESGYTTVCYIPAGDGIPGVAAAYKTAGPKDSPDDEEDRLVEGSSYLAVSPKWGSKGKKTLRDALKKAEDEIEKVKKAREEWDKKQEENKKKAEAEKKKNDKPKDEDGDGNGEDKARRHRRSDHTFRVQKDGDEEPPDKPKNGDKNGEKKEADKPEEFKPPKIDPKHQPLVDLIEKKEGSRMMIRLTRASALLHLDDVLEQYDELPYALYLASSFRSDYHHIVEQLGEREAMVAIRPEIRNLPNTTFRYNLTDRLDRAGCTVSTVPFADTRVELMRVRERMLDLMRAGLSRKTAIKSLTLNPAEAIGLGERLGSLEKGKDGDLLFFSGDPLDLNSQLERVMILGNIVWTADKD